MPPREAVANWQSASDPATAHNNLAAVWIEKGNYPEARKELDLALGYNRAHSGGPTKPGIGGPPGRQPRYAECEACDAETRAGSVSDRPAQAVCRPVGRFADGSGQKRRRPVTEEER